MTSPRQKKSFLIITGLAMAVSVALTGMMAAPAEASTRVNETIFRMSKQKLFNFCNARKAAIHCFRGNVSCGCDDGHYRWVYVRRDNQSPLSHVIRSPSPKRASRLMAGDERGSAGGGGRSGGTNGKP